MAYTQWTVVYGEQPSASKWNILGSNDAHFYSFLGDDEAWDTYTPTVINFTQGTSTIEGWYKKIGTTVQANVKIICGTGFAMGSNPEISLPVTAASDYSNLSRGGGGVTRSTGSSNFYGGARLNTATRVLPTVYLCTGTYATLSSITSAIPFTWAVGDILTCNWAYEAAE